MMVCSFLKWALPSDCAAQGGGGGAISANVPEMNGCGIYCCSLVDMMLFDQRLDLMILEISSNLYDSMIPYLPLLLHSISFFSLTNLAFISTC